MIWLSGKFFLRYTAVSPEQARWLHLARSGSQSQRAIWVILPAFSFPKTLNVRGEAEGNIEVEGKQNSLFPEGAVISVLLYLPIQK